MRHEFQICVSSELAKLAQIADFVSEQARLAGLGDDDVFSVQMAVDEACTNAIEHGYDGRDDGQVHVCCYLEEDDFVVRIVDTGPPFDPSTAPTPDLTMPLEERMIGGLGVFFMYKLMDRVEYSYQQDVGNQVVMRKRLQTDASLPLSE